MRSSPSTLLCGVSESTVIVVFRLYSRYQSDPSQWFRGNYKTTKVLTNAETEELMKAYQNSLLLVSSRSEFGEYDEFLYKMKKAMSEPPFSINTYDRKFVFGNRTIDTFNVKVRARRLSRECFASYLWPRVFPSDVENSQLLPWWMLTFGRWVVQVNINFTSECWMFRATTGLSHIHQRDTRYLAATLVTKQPFLLPGNPWQGSKSQLCSSCSPRCSLGISTMPPICTPSRWIALWRREEIRQTAVKWWRTSLGGSSPVSRKSVPFVSRYCLLLCSSRSWFSPQLNSFSLSDWLMRRGK